MCKPLKWIVVMAIVFAFASLGAAAWAYTTEVYVIWQPTSGGSWRRSQQYGRHGRRALQSKGCAVVRSDSLPRRGIRGPYWSIRPHTTTSADTLTFSSATPNASWGDPDVNHGVVYEASASQEYRHYIQHNINVTGRYTYQGTNTDDPKTMSVNVLNVKVVNTTTTGTIIPWDPDTMSSMTMACNLSHAQNCTAGVSYNIYDTMANGYGTLRTR